MLPKKIMSVLLNADMETKAGEGEGIAQCGIEFLYFYMFQKKHIHEKREHKLPVYVAFNIIICITRLKSDVSFFPGTLKDSFTFSFTHVMQIATNGDCSFPSLKKLT